MAGGSTRQERQGVKKKQESSRPSRPRPTRTSTSRWGARERSASTDLATDVRGHRRDPRRGDDAIVVSLTTIARLTATKVIALADQDERTPEMSARSS